MNAYHQLYYRPSGWKRTTPKAKISAWNGAGSWVVVVFFCWFFFRFFCAGDFWGILGNPIYCIGSKTEFGSEKIITPGTSDESIIWSTGQWEHNQNTSASNPFHKNIHHHILTRLFSSKSWRILKINAYQKKIKNNRPIIFELKRFQVFLPHWIRPIGPSNNQHPATSRYIAFGVNLDFHTSGAMKAQVPWKVRSMEVSTCLAGWF